MTTEQAERERREESLRRCRENEKASKGNTRYGVLRNPPDKTYYMRHLLAWL